MQRTTEKAALISIGIPVGMMTVSSARHVLFLRKMNQGKGLSLLCKSFRVLAPLVLTLEICQGDRLPLGHLFEKNYSTSGTPPQKPRNLAR